jgi:hypothetical protein
MLAVYSPPRAIIFLPALPCKYRENPSAAAVTLCSIAPGLLPAGVLQRKRSTLIQ